MEAECSEVLWKKSYVLPFGDSKTREECLSTVIDIEFPYFFKKKVNIIFTLKEKYVHIIFFPTWPCAVSPVDLDRVFFVHIKLSWGASWSDTQVLGSVFGQGPLCTWQWSIFCQPRGASSYNPPLWACVSSYFEQIDSFCPSWPKE